MTSNALPTAEEIVDALERHPEVRDRVREMLVDALAKDAVNALLTGGRESEALVTATASNYISSITARKPYRLRLDSTDLRKIPPSGWAPDPGKVLLDFRVPPEAIRQAHEVVYWDGKREHVLKSRTGTL